MKQRRVTGLLFPVLLILISFLPPVVQNDAVTGSWYSKAGAQEETMTFMDGYFVHSTFNKSDKKFFGTWGGPYQFKDGQLQVKVEFNSVNEAQVGEEIILSCKVSGRQLQVAVNGKKPEFTQTDNGTGDLAGTWQITGRMRNGELSPMRPGPRKTLKILSGKRFQWVAMNTESKQFSGTGGGTYTFTNGTYTEYIEFFSRDSSRVGASLSFEGSVQNKEWTHKGSSSRGEPVHEVWKRIVN